MGAYAPIIAMVASAVQGRQEAANIGAEKQAARNSQRLAMQQGSAAEDTQRRQNALKLGEQRAAAAQSGFDSSLGSLASVQAQSAGELELDALTTRYDSLLRSIGFENQVRVKRAGERNARHSGYLGAASALGSGSSSMGIGYGG